MAEFDPFALGAERIDSAPAFDPFAMGAERLGAEPQSAKTDDGGFFRKLDSFVRGAADAMTFGFDDEIAAFMGAATGIDGTFGDYAGNLERQREVKGERQKTDRVASIGGQLTGALGVGIGAAPRTAMTLGARMRQGMRFGALGGAAYGAGSGEGMQDRALGAATGAAVGALTGGALPGVTHLAGKAYNAITSATVRPAVNALRSTFDPRANALQLTQRALGRDQMTPQSAGQAMQKAIDAGDDSMMLMDVAGDNARRLGRFAANMPGVGADKIKEALFTRQLAQSDRVSDAIRSGLGDPEKYFSTIDEIIATRASAAKPLYEKFYAAPVHFSEKLEDLLGRGAVMRKALSKARDIASTEGTPFEQFFAQVADDGTYTIRRVPDAKAWDQIKRALDDVIQDNTQVLPNGAEKLNNFGRVVSNLKSEMVKEIDRLNPYYKLARMAYSSASESLEAVTKGKKLLNADPELARRELRKMSEPDQQLARIGVAKAMTDRIQATADGLNVVRKVFGAPKQRKLLRELFPSQKAFDEFKTAMEREAAKTRTNQAIQGNSTTARQLADIADNQIDMGVIGSVATGRLDRAAGALVQKALSRATVVNEATAREIADILTSSDPQITRKILSEMQRMAETDQRVAQNLAAVQNILRSGFITAETQRGTEALTGALQ